MILDEATSALDVDSERLIRETIDSLHGKVTILTIAHRLSTIQGCDRIFLLEGGKLIAEGNYNELHENSSLFRRLAGALSTSGTVDK